MRIEKNCYKEHQRDCQTMKTIYFINSILKLTIHERRERRRSNEHNETQMLLFILPILFLRKNPKLPDQTECLLHLDKCTQNILESIRLNNIHHYSGFESSNETTKSRSSTWRFCRFSHSSSMSGSRLKRLCGWSFVSCRCPNAKIVNRFDVFEVEGEILFKWSERYH